ncbi:MAG: hypothetical protein MJ100_09905 [Ruminococcus sp.]|nr:hypothetical protein [Ruminococcus sp.]
MEKSKEMGEFFDSPFTKEYLQYSDVILRYSASLMKSLCVSEDGTPVRVTPENQKLITDMCGRMLRLSEISMCLADNCEMKREYIEMKEFSDEFAKKCLEATGGRVCVSVAECDKFRIIAEPELLKYMLLEFVRIAIENAEDEMPHFELECGECADSARIKLNVSGYGGEIPDRSFFMCDELYDVYSKDICRRLAKKMGAECSFSDEALVIDFPLHNDDDKIIMRSAGCIPEGDELSPYKLMLSEFE